MLYSFHRVGKIRFCTALLVLILGWCAPSSVYAQGSAMSLTVAPPLIQVNLSPGETWSSQISVVNDNPYNVTLFAEPVLFKPSGESGRPVFINPPQSDGLLTGPDTTTLAGWITVPQGPLEVVREQTYELPIVIRVPNNAAPGGHYAAVLIGNRAPESSSEGSSVSVTSSIAALVFLSVSGDVVEKGRIRDFVTEKSLYEMPEATLSLRFENQGNVHLLPQGTINIYNMFGKMRGSIPVNQNKDYGNVLPESIRKFTYTWKSDVGLWDIGRYKAEAVIVYGKDQKQTTLASTYFYILPIVPLLEVIGVVLALVLFFGWALRAYIRRALAIEAQYLRQTQGEHQLQSHVPQERVAVSAHHEPKLKLETLVKPIQVGMIDLRQMGKQAPSVHHVFEERGEGCSSESVSGLRGYITKYRAFFIFIVITLLGVFAVGLYIKDVMKSSREYTVSEVRSDGGMVDLRDGE